MMSHLAAFGAAMQNDSNASYTEEQYPAWFMSGYINGLPDAKQQNWMDYLVTCWNPIDGITELLDQAVKQQAAHQYDDAVQSLWLAMVRIDAGSSACSRADY